MSFYLDHVTTDTLQSDGKSSNISGFTKAMRQLILIQVFLFFVTLKSRNNSRYCSKRTSKAEQHISRIQENKTPDTKYIKTHSPQKEKTIRSTGQKPHIQPKTKRIFSSKSLCWKQRLKGIFDASLKQLHRGEFPFKYL